MSPFAANAVLITTDIGTVAILGNNYEVTLVQDDAGIQANSFNAIMPSITFDTLATAISAMEAIQNAVGNPFTFDWTPAFANSNCCTRIVYSFDASNYQYITNFNMISPFTGPLDLSRDFANLYSFAQFAQIAEVPEPGTLALLGLGLVGMGLTRRRKKA